MYDLSEIRRANLRALIEKEGGSQAAFARKLGKSPQQINSMLKGQKAFGASIAREIESKLGLFPGQLDKESSAAPCVRGFLVGEEPVPAGYVAIPEYQLRFSAGGDGNVPGSEPEWEIVNDSTPAIYRDDFLTSRGLTQNNTMRAKVNGDSMEPFLFKNDTILIKCFSDPHPCNVHIHDGDIYALLVDGEYRVKRLSKVKNGIRISSDNPEYKDEIYTGGEVDDKIRIYGRVVELSRTL